MSLAIDIRAISAVLLVDGWHDVQPGTFDLDSYEFRYEHPDAGRDDIYVHLGGQSDVCATGFVFDLDDGSKMYGPLTAILAVRTRPADERSPGSRSDPT